MTEVIPVPIVIPSKEVKEMTVFDYLKDMLYNIYQSNTNNECLIRVEATKQYLEEVVLPIQTQYINLNFTSFIVFTIILGISIITLLLIRYLTSQVVEVKTNCGYKYIHKYEKYEGLFKILFIISIVLIIVSSGVLTIELCLYSIGKAHLNDLITIDNILTNITKMKVCKKEIILKAIKIIHSW